MWARVTTVEAPPDQADIGIKVVEEQVIPTAREWDGFSGGWWLLDRNKGKMMGITLWDSEETLRSSAEAASGLRQEASSAIGGEVVSVDEYEVIAQV